MLFTGVTCSIHHQQQCTARDKEYNEEILRLKEVAAKQKNDAATELVAFEKRLTTLQKDQEADR